MLASIPLLIIPFILYNIGLTGVIGGTAEAGAAAGASVDPWATVLFEYTMMSGGVFRMTLGDALIVLSLVLLFIEIFKSTRTSNWSIIDHLLSTLVFVAFLVEFLLVQGAVHSVFFIIMVIALVDLLAGFAVSIRSAGRDITMST
jgi:hypothetical protein